MKPVRVLLVNDQMLIREGLRLLLESTGDIAVAISALDGREAVRALKKHRVDVAVVCVVRDEFRGITSARQIREAFQDLEIVTVLVQSLPGYLCDLLARHSLCHVVRPATSTELVEAVLAVQAGRGHSALTAFPAARTAPSSRKAENRTDPLRILSRREREVLRHILAGHASKEIASRLRLASSTVDTYRSRIMEKLGIDSTAALIKFALENGMNRPT